MSIQSIISGWIVLLFAAPVALAQHGAPPARPDVKPGELTPWTRLLVEAIEAAHGTEQLREPKSTLAFDLTFTMQGHPSFTGTVHLEPSAGSRGRARLVSASGATLLDDGTRFWMSRDCETVVPAQSKAEAIFLLKALPHFAGMPFRLRDTHVVLAPSGRREVAGVSYHAATMTFPGMDDWFGIFAHMFQDRVMLMPWFITTPDTVEPEVGLPPAYVVEFSDFEETDDVTLARTWTIRRWHRVDGPIGDPIGSASVKNVRVTELDEAIFTKPEGAVELMTMPSVKAESEDSSDEQAEDAPTP